MIYPKLIEPVNRIEPMAVINQFLKLFLILKVRIKILPHANKEIVKI